MPALPRTKLLGRDYWAHGMGGFSAIAIGSSGIAVSATNSADQKPSGMRMTVGSTGLTVGLGSSNADKGEGL